MVSEFKFDLINFNLNLVAHKTDVHTNKDYSIEEREIV